MRFNGISILTDDFEGMTKFYKEVLQAEVKGNEVIAAFKVRGAKFSICSTSVMRSMAPGSMQGAGNGSYTIEMEVEDVDQEYERLKALNVTIVKEPSTQTWGRRSVWIRDPQGNIINLFKKVGRGAGKK